MRQKTRFIPTDMVPAPLELKLPQKQSKLKRMLKRHRDGKGKLELGHLLYVAANAKLEFYSRWYLAEGLFEELFRSDKGHKYTPVFMSDLDRHTVVPFRRRAVNSRMSPSTALTESVKEDPLIFAKHPEKALRIMGLMALSDTYLKHLLFDPDPVVVRDAAIMGAIRAIDGADNLVGIQSPALEEGIKWNRETNREHLKFAAPGAIFTGVCYAVDRLLHLGIPTEFTVVPGVATTLPAALIKIEGMIKERRSLKYLRRTLGRRE